MGRAVYHVAGVFARPFWHDEHIYNSARARRFDPAKRESGRYQYIPCGIASGTEVLTITNPVYVAVQ
jgi:hypothetical protein